MEAHQQVVQNVMEQKNTGQEIVVQHVLELVQLLTQVIPHVCVILDTMQVEIVVLKIHVHGSKLIICMDLLMVTHIHVLIQMLNGEAHVLRRVKILW